MKNLLDREKFGPWALITGASSGIGKEFANQLAANGFNLILVARRIHQLEEIGKQLAYNYSIQYKTIESDLSESSSIDKIIQATNDFEIGLLISNAATGKPRNFFSVEESELKYIIQLNAISHLSLTHYFGKRMAERKRGGVLLVGAMGAKDGIPYMANEAGTKGYIQSLGKSLHTELKEFGLHITVLETSPTETPVLSKLGFTKQNTPISPISVEQCVREALLGLNKNKITVLPGLKFRIMSAIIPSSILREVGGKIFKKNNHL